MLLGQYSANLGEKRRVAVPKKFRIDLGETMIISRWYEKCLVLVSEAKWNSLLAKITGQSKHIVLSVRDTERFILGSAFNIGTDDQGRVILPDLLCNYAGLTEEIVFVGLVDRVEIWNKNEWIKHENTIAEKATQLLEEIASNKNEGNG